MTENKIGPVVKPILPRPLPPVAHPVHPHHPHPHHPHLPHPHPHHPHRLDGSELAKLAGGAAPTPLAAIKAPLGDSADRSVSSTGDPHETSADGLKYDNQKEGDFVKLRSQQGDFVVQAHQETYTEGTTVMTKAAVKLGNDVVNYDAASGALTINGEAAALEVGVEQTLADGGKVLLNEDGTYSLTSALGDTVKIDPNVSGDGMAYLDLYATASPLRRDGELRGELGAIDADTDTSNDLIGRDGKVYTVDQLDAFLESWRVPEGASLMA